MSHEQPGGGLTYADAGVDIAAGNALVERIKPMVAATHRPGVLGGLGGFGGLFELPLDRYRQPVMVSGADGVGTKLRLAIECDRHGGIGQDLVAMCVNDILVCGAEPLWFLDYYATGSLDVDRAATIIEGIARGCVQAGAALLGGETAEMPGHYQGEDYDLAGFAVGIVEKQALIDGADTRVGDVLIGLASSGPHANGFSLIRKIVAGHDLEQPVANGPGTLADALLAPTRIYVQSLLDTIHKFPVRAMAHITGGGLLENIPRSLPDGLQAQVHRSAWQQPPVFDWLQRTGGIDDMEFLRTFNAGIGWVMVVPATSADAITAHLSALGEQPCRLGEIKASHDMHAPASIDIVR